MNNYINLMKETFGLNFIKPIKGTKKKILDLAYDNAKNYYNEQISLLRKDEKLLDLYNKCLPPRDAYYYFPKGDEIVIYNKKQSTLFVDCFYVKL